MTRPAEVLAGLLAQRAQDQRRARGVYENRHPAGGARPAQWLSDSGFLLHTSFGYAPAASAHYYPADPLAPRTIRRILFIGYGGGRDYQRLTSPRPSDNRVHSQRAPDRAGLAAWPLDPNFLGTADIDDNTATRAKTSTVLTALRETRQGPAYHAVITRSGAIVITAPLDGVVMAHPQGKDAVCVAVETAYVRPRAGGVPVEAPFTLPQLVTMAAYVAKVRTAYPTIPLTLGDADDNGLTYTFLGAELFLLNTRKNLQGVAGGELGYTEVLDSSFLARINAEPVYRLSEDVFTPRPPRENARAQAQAVIGHHDTAGQEALQLGAYMDLASADRSDQAQQTARAALFVRRSAHAAADADASAEMAGHVAQADQLGAPPTVMTESDGWTYNYSTGQWGREDPVHSGGTV